METYSEKMSKKIMNATDSELEEISDDLEMNVYEALAPEAKARIAKFF